LKYRSGEAAACGEGTLSQKKLQERQCETTSASPVGLFPRYNMDSAVPMQDNSFNGASSNMLGESCLAGDVTRHLSSSSSDILTAGNRRVPVKVAR